MFLVQLCVILVRNGMFIEEKQIVKFGFRFYYLIGTVYIYLWKKNYKSLTLFGNALCKK